MSETKWFLRELDDAISRGTAESRLRALWHTTDLMIAGRYSDDEIWTFGEVIGRLTDEIEVAARSQLAKRLADFDRAPVNIIHKLAFDDEIEVAGPVLRELRAARALCPDRQCLPQKPDPFAGDLETKIDRRTGHRRAGDPRQPGSRQLRRNQQRRALLGFRLFAHDPARRRQFHSRRAARSAQGHPEAGFPAADRKGVGQRRKSGSNTSAPTWSIRSSPR